MLLKNHLDMCRGKEYFLLAMYISKRKTSRMAVGQETSFRNHIRYPVLRLADRDTKSNTSSISLPKLISRLHLYVYHWGGVIIKGRLISPHWIENKYCNFEHSPKTGPAAQTAVPNKNSLNPSVEKWSY